MGMCTAYWCAFSSSTSQISIQKLLAWSSSNLPWHLNVGAGANCNLSCPFPSYPTPNRINWDTKLQFLTPLLNLSLWEASTLLQSEITTNRDLMKPEVRTKFHIQIEKGGVKGEKWIQGVLLSQSSHTLRESLIWFRALCKALKTQTPFFFFFSFFGATG